MRSSMAVRVGVAGVFGFALVQFAQVSREATLTVRIVDAATGRATPVRVRLEDSNRVRPRVRGAVAVSDSAIPVPKQAIAVMWGQNDRAQGYAIQPDGSFYVDGAFEVKVPAGRYSLLVTKGNEYTRVTDTVELAAGAAAAREYKMTRWIDMPGRGWYSSDDHIHLRRSPGDDHAIAQWIAAEDIHVGHLLQMGDFWTLYFAQYAFGERGRYAEAGRILSPGQEDPRTPEIGHTISLGADDFARAQGDYYSFDRLFDRVHELGGVSGFAHQGMSFHGYRGMALTTLRGKTDFLELAQFCVPEGPLALEHYYEFLDLGIKLTALAGSDFPWCGQGPGPAAQIGNARFYTYTGGELNFARWMAGMKAGHTFVTTGPLLTLTVNRKMPGDSVDVTKGSTVSIAAEALAPATVGTVEIVGHGKVLAKASGRVALSLPVDHGMWIAARCDAGNGMVAHTTPVYVTVNGGGFENRANYRENLAKMEGYLKELEGELASPGTSVDSQTFRHKAQLQREIAEARGKLRELGGSAGLGN
uniref:Uncharacterized protein n=1 Tax=Solibacter usitatus (strain Ellin6076) TaxID=234267 RepID=Q01YL3_SOLUE